MILLISSTLFNLHYVFILQIGCDASTKLAEVCSNRNIEVLTADCLRLPFRNDCADVVICIAVIHHLSTKVLLLNLIFLLFLYYKVLCKCLSKKLIG